MSAPAPYPPIGDYAFIGDCHSAALVSRAGAIDWCCLPRFDAASCFGRLLDWQHGGDCAITPQDGGEIAVRQYLGHSLVLVTTYRTAGGEARVLDCLTMRRGGKLAPHHQLLRIVEGVRGRVDFDVHIAPRFDYGAVQPWIRREGVGIFSAIGGNDALVIQGDAALALTDGHALRAAFTVHAHERVRLSLSYRAPDDLDRTRPTPIPNEELDERLQATLDWWERWSSQVTIAGPNRPNVIRSAITLKGLSHAPTGAITAAATTSLPETIGGARNWDYRFSWIRDSSFSVRALTAVGCVAEAGAFRRFIERAAAGSAKQLQIMYGVGGERRLTELTLDHLEGYRKSAPVRIGNAASGQVQLDAYGELVDLTWRWHQRGESPDDEYWRFLLELVETAVEWWNEPDCGLWESRGAKQHFVHSKVMCWAAVDRGIRLAEACLRTAPVQRWKRARHEIRGAIEEHGYEEQRGIFTQAFGSPALDSALLLLPTVDFVAWDDPRMVRTVDAIRAELDAQGLLLRYQRAKTDDGLNGPEGAFLACTFWLAEALARQGRRDAAREVFDRVASTCNDLGLYAEQYDPHTGELLGNFPQGLTHLSHIAAAVAIAEHQEPEVQ